MILLWHGEVVCKRRAVVPDALQLFIGTLLSQGLFETCSCQIPLEEAENRTLFPVR